MPQVCCTGTWRVATQLPTDEFAHPLAMIADRSNTDTAGRVDPATRRTCTCASIARNTASALVNGASVLCGVLDDMERKDAQAKGTFGEEYDPSKLGAKPHRAVWAFGKLTHFVPKAPAGVILPSPPCSRCAQQPAGQLIPVDLVFTSANPLCLRTVAPLRPPSPRNSTPRCLIQPS